MGRHAASPPIEEALEESDRRICLATMFVHLVSELVPRARKLPVRLTDHPHSAVFNGCLFDRIGSKPSRGQRLRPYFFNSYCINSLHGQFTMSEVGHKNESPFTNREVPFLTNKCPDARTRTTRVRGAKFFCPIRNANPLAKW